MHGGRAVHLARHCRMLALIAVVGATRALPAQQPEVVRSTAPPAWGDRLRLVEEVRIGKLEGDAEYLFGSIEGVAVGRDGMIHVADGQVPIIRSYDAQGRFVRNVGGKGQGPGEFQNIGGMKMMPDGRIVVWDNQSQRITLYSGSGEYITSHAVPSGLFSSDLLQVDRTGHIYVRTVTESPRDGGTWKLGWIRVAPGGQIRDTIPIPSDSARAESFVLATPSGYDRPFVRELVSAMSPLGYLITGRTGTYAFDQHRPGASVLRIERPNQPVIRLTGPERAEWEAWAESFTRSAATPRPARPGVITPPPRRVTYTIPDTKPAFSELRTDSQGRIWVRRYVPAVSNPGPERQPGDDRPRRVWREPPTFDLFEPTGQFLGMITLPWGAYMYDAIDRHIWAEVRGESDESYVVRFRVESSAGR